MDAGILKGEDTPSKIFIIQWARADTMVIRVIPEVTVVAEQREARREAPAAQRVREEPQVVQVVSKTRNIRGARERDLVLGHLGDRDQSISIEIFPREKARHFSISRETGLR
jgi:hypothetical protein